MERHGAFSPSSNHKRLAFAVSCSHSHETACGAHERERDPRTREFCSRDGWLLGSCFSEKNFLHGSIQLHAALLSPPDCESATMEKAGSL